MIKVADYIPFVEFLGQAMGKNCEIVLHDLSNPDSSIIAISNGELSGREVGGPVTDLLLKVLKNGDSEHNSYYANYHGKNINGHICLCSSFFIHDESQKTIGVLCVNKDVTPYLEARKFITDNIICDGIGAKDVNDDGKIQEHEAINIFENFQGSVSDVIDTLINNSLTKYAVAPDRLSLDERMSIVEELNDNGLFLLKGGITALAERLSMSEPTIYRYLSKLKKDS